MISANHDAAFTWNTATFTWDDPAAGKTWDTAYTTHYTLAPTEDVAITINDKRASHITSQETAHLTRATTRHSTHTATSPLMLREQTDRTTAFTRQAEERLKTNATACRCTALSHIDRIDCTEQRKTRSAKHHHNTIAVTETHTRTADYRRTTQEKVLVSADSKRSTARTAHASLKLTDTYLTPWQGTLASITLIAGSLDDTSWTRLSASPSGYEAFHPFEVGEYTYRDALVRLLLTTGAAGADPLLYDVAFHVDIEDTHESGTAECTKDEGARITLKHHYHHAPRIVLTVLSADTTNGMPIPHLISQSETDGVRSFDCELRLPSGARTSGTVSWLAEGY